MATKKQTPDQPTAFPIELIPVFAIRMDGGTHARAGMSDRLVARYAEKMRRKVKLPPIVVFYDGTHHWLADGFHRVLAAMNIGAHRILAEIRPGTLRDARCFYCGANTDHGEGRSDDDDRVAVLLMLQDWPTQTNTARRPTTDPDEAHRHRNPPEHVSVELRPAA